jgi:Rps23 Pro-64 3,4-dihydroxylase Tpa1-like proline 4-hydroxylase
MQNLPETTDILLSGLRFNETPFPHFSLTQVFSQESAAALYKWFEECDLWSYRQTTFYTQYEFSLIGLELPQTLNFLNIEDTLSFLTRQFEESFGRNLKVIEITAHKLINGYRMGVHNDFIGKDETHRLVIQINSNWAERNGGYLMLFNSERPDDVSRIVKPLNNTGIGFEISEKSFHAVSTVHDFTRYTLVYTFKEAD